MAGSTRMLAAAILAVSLFSAPLYGQSPGLVDRTFSDIKIISLTTLLGGCMLSDSEDGDVHVTVAYSYPDADFEACMDAVDGDLRLKEKAELDWKHSDLEGKSTWMIRVPAGTRIIFCSITGSFLATGADLELELETISGEIGLRRCSGTFKVHSGTGDINVLDCTGDFGISGGTGTISLVDSEGSFSVASENGMILFGEVSVEGGGDFQTVMTRAIRKFSPFGITDITMATETGRSVEN